MGLTVLAPALLCCIAIAQLWPGLSQDLSPPISWDHGAHLGKVIQTAHELLPFLRGWSDNVELGVPLNALYTPSGTIFVLLVRAVTPWLEWTQTYAIAIALFRCLVALSVYRLARVAGAIRRAAFLAGVIILADVGDHSEGGWFYDVLYGVWPMSLGMALFFFAVADLIRFLDEGRRVHAARAMLLLGIALFSHQMVLLGSLSILPMLLLSRWLDTGKFMEPARRIAGVFLVGVLISAWWLFPLLTNTRWLDDHGQLYVAVREMGSRALSGSIAPNMGPWTGVLFVVALIVGFFATGTRRFLALATALMLVLSTKDWLLVTDAISWLPPLGRIMYPRFMMLAKPMGFVLIGLFASVLFDLVRTHLQTQRRSVVWTTFILLFAFLIPFQAGVRSKASELLIERDVTTTASRPGFQDYLDYAAWMRSQASEPFFRVAYSDATSHIFQSAAALTEKPAHKMGMLIAEAFGNVSPSDDVRALREMNVRYLVFWGTPKASLTRAARRVRSFGPITVFELEAWDPRVAVDVAGLATPVITSREHERLVIDPGGATDILVRRAAGPGWRATADGNAIPIHEEPLVFAPELRVMRLEVPPGTRELLLEYKTLTPFGVIAIGLTLLGLIVAVLVWIGSIEAWWQTSGARRRVLALAARVPPRWASRRRLIPVAIGVFLLIGTLLYATRSYHFTPDSKTARVELVHRRAVEQCTENREAGGHACAGQEWLAVGPTVMSVEGRLRSCTWAHPPAPGDILRATFENVQLSDVLRIGGGISDDVRPALDGGVVSVRVVANGAPLGSLDVPASRLWFEETLETEPGEATVVFEITARVSNSQRWFCFDAIAEGGL